MSQLQRWHHLPSSNSVGWRGRWRLCCASPPSALLSHRWGGCEVAVAAAQAGPQVAAVSLVLLHRFPSTARKLFCCFLATAAKGQHPAPTRLPQGIAGSVPWSALAFLTLYFQLLGMSNGQASSLVALFLLGGLTSNGRLGAGTCRWAVAHSFGAAPTQAALQPAHPMPLPGRHRCGWPDRRLCGRCRCQALAAARTHCRHPIQCVHRHPFCLPGVQGRWVLPLITCLHCC